MSQITGLCVRRSPALSRRRHHGLAEIHRPSVARGQPRPPWCGPTRRNMAGLQALWTEFHERGFCHHRGVPSTISGGQEPGGRGRTSAEDRRKASIFKLPFPILGQGQSSTGPGRHIPSYKWAGAAGRGRRTCPAGTFHKYSDRAANGRDRRTVFALGRRNPPTPVSRPPSGSRPPGGQLSCGWLRN